MLRALLLSAALALPAAAQEAPARAPIPGEVLETARELMAKGLEDETGYEVIEGLTTEVGARLAGSDAEARARAWSEEKLKALGFENVRTEPFEIPYWERVYEEARIVSPYPQALEVTALGNSVGTPEGGVRGEVVRFETLADLEVFVD